MSLATWKTEFYPTPADTPSLLEDPLKAARHSLHKWRGALPENVKKHGVLYDTHAIRKFLDNGLASETFYFDAVGCSLCAFAEAKYWALGNLKNSSLSEDELDELDELEKCQRCPLWEMTGDACDGLGAAYGRSKNDPTLMIYQLQELVEHLEKQAYDAADQKYLAQQLDGCESPEEQQAVMKGHYGT